MTVKCTYFCEIAPEYKDGNVYRIGGWSESFYHDSTLASGQAEKVFDTLIGARAKLLPKQASIVAKRFQDVAADGRPGRAKVRLVYIRGNTAYDTDVPNLAYVARVYAKNNKPNHRLLELRGFPDVMCVKGEASLDAPWQSFRDLYYQVLIDNFQFRGNILDGPTAHITSVSADGSVVTDEDFVNNLAGKKVTIVRALINGTRDDFFGGTFKVGAQPSLRLTTLLGYNGPACTKGTIRAYGHDFFGIESIDSESVYTRKVGRPFYQYRGKASAKR